MNEFPRARVVRGGDGRDRSNAGVEPALKGRNLRLAPRPLQLALILHLLFGGLAAAGWLLAVIGTIPVCGLVLGIDRTSSAAYDRETSARITIVVEDDAGGYSVSYAFLDEAGVERRSMSYAAEHPPPVPAWRVDYQSGDPSESRLRGMHRHPVHPLWAWLMFPLLAVPRLAILAMSLPTAVRGLWLLRNGTETNGRLIGQGKIQMEVEGVPVMELTFEYDVGGKTYSTTVYGPRPGTLDVEQSATILYNPRAPARATTLDHIIGAWVCGCGDGLTAHTVFSIAPGPAEVTATGELESRPGFTILLILLPALFVGLLTAMVIHLI